LEGEKMKVVAIIGIGMGNPKNITIEGMAYIRNAEIIIGNERLVSAFGESFKEDVKVFKLNSIKEITCLVENEIIAKDTTIAILVSGDTGYFSEADRMIESFVENPEIEIKNIPGISSLSYFSSKLNLSYDNAFSVNLHGEEEKIIQYVATHKKVFCLSGGDVEKLLGELIKARAVHTLPESIRIYIGERLSYEDEKIIYSTIKDIHKHKEEIQSMSTLAVFMFENDEALF
jgi:precorrin-6B C5,15-methyltransferase / cobalt-precorrin-6B C5,C15-methyltransferase